MDGMLDPVGENHPVVLEQVQNVFVNEGRAQRVTTRLQSQCVRDVVNVSVEIVRGFEIDWTDVANIEVSQVEPNRTFRECRESHISGNGKVPLALGVVV